VRPPWLAHDEAPGPYITIPQYRFNKTKQHTHHQARQANIQLDQVRQLLKDTGDFGKDRGRGVGADRRRGG